MDKLKIGLIGTGRLGALYADYLATRIPQAELFAVAGHRAGEIASQYGVTVASNDRLGVINNHRVDAFVICSSTDTHVQFIREAFRVKKPVFCEKPLCLRYEDTQVLLDEQNDTYFQQGFMRRFDPHYITAKTRIEDDVIGRPVLFKSTSRDMTRTSIEYAKTSGGLIIDMGIHDIDLARFFVGEIDDIHTVGRCLVFPELGEIGDIDNAIMTLRFKQGALGVIDISRNASYGYDVTTEILGTKGAVRVGYLTDVHVQTMLYDSLARPTLKSFMDRFEQSFINQLDNYVRNVLEGNPSPVTLRDGIEAVRWAEIARKQSDNRPIENTLFGAHRI